MTYKAHSLQSGLVSFKIGCQQGASMMEVLYSSLSYCLLVSFLLFAGLRNRWSPAIRISISAFAASVLLFFPFTEVSLSWYLKGTLGSLSIVTTALIFIELLSKLTFKKMITNREKQLFTPAVLGLAVLLYASSYHREWADLYALGLLQGEMMMVLMVVALVAWSFRLRFTSVVICLAMLGFSLNILASNNVWDYLFDPVLLMMLMVWGLNTIKTPWAKRSLKRQPNESF